MQKKKLSILILGLACIGGLTLFYIRFLVQGKQLPFFGTGKKEKPTDFVGQSQGSSTDEYRALSEKLMGLPLIAEYTVLPESVLYAGALIVGADPATFQKLGDAYAKDSTHIYFKGRVVSKADHDSFQVVESGGDWSKLDFIAEDKNAVFVEDKALHIPKKELFLQFYTFPSVRFLGEGKYDTRWAVFDKHLYYYAIDTYGGGFSRISLLKGVQPEKVRILLDDKSQETAYLTDGTDVYYADEKVSGVDAATFKIGQNYAKDKYSVYQGSKKILGADPKTFVEGETPYYPHDAKHVYYNTKLIEGTDIKTFQVVDGSYDYSRDKDHVYYRGKRIPAADPDSFVVVGSVCWYSSYVVFGKDKDTVFRNGERLSELDPKTFELVDEMYARDAKTILKCGREKVSEIESRIVNPAPVVAAPAAPVDERENLDQGYYRDREGVIYYNNEKVEGADAETFASFKGVYGWATDKNFVYQEGKVVGSK